MYIVIEQYPVPSIVCDPEGHPLMFDSRADAEFEANEWQCGLVVKLTQTF